MERSALNLNSEYSLKDNHVHMTMKEIETLYKKGKKIPENILITKHPSEVHTLNDVDASNSIVMLCAKKFPWLMNVKFNHICIEEFHTNSPLTDIVIDNSKIKKIALMERFDHLYLRNVDKLSDMTIASANHVHIENTPDLNQLNLLTFNDLNRIDIINAPNLKSSPTVEVIKFSAAGSEITILKQEDQYLFYNFKGTKERIISTYCRKGRETWDKEEKEKLKILHIALEQNIIT